MISKPLADLSLYAILLAAGQAMFKFAATGTKASSASLIAYAQSLFISPIFLSACVLYAVSTVIWVSLLRRYPLSQAYPVVIAISILLTTATGLLLFNENIYPSKLVGLALITVGVLVLARTMS